MTNVLRQAASIVALFALCFTGLPRGAQAQAAHTIVVALGEDVDPRLLSSLRAELGLRSLSLIVEPTLAGETAETRQQAAQARAEAAHAHATLWLEESQVHALSVDGNHRYAVLPRPASRISPRVFAVLAMSALDELNIVVPDVPVASAPEPSAEGVEEEASEASAATTSEAPSEATNEAPIETTNEATAATTSEAPSEAPTETTNEATNEAIDEAPTEANDETTNEATERSRAFDLSNPVGTQPATASDVRDGAVHGYFALDGMVGGVWDFGGQNNIAHILQRFTGGLQWELLRAEFSGSFGLENGLSGSYTQSLMGDFVFFVGAGIPVGDVSVDVGGLGGLVLHGLSEASGTRSGDVLTSGRLGGAFGISTPDGNSALVFRARLELGLFARVNPSVATLFTNIFVGIAFR